MTHQPLPERALEISYNEQGKGWFKRKLAVLVLAWFLVVMGLILIYLSWLSIRLALGREIDRDEAATEAFSLALVGGLSALVLGLSIFLVIWWTTAVPGQPPRAAVRFDSSGVSMWPLGTGGFMVPWEGIVAIVAKPDRLHIQMVNKVHEVPGVIGLTAFGAAMASKYSNSLQWRYIEAPPPQTLGAAIHELSSGRVTLQQGHV